MRLIETWLADQERAFDLFAKFPAEETGFENPAAGMNRERFAVGYSLQPVGADDDEQPES